MIPAFAVVGHPNKGKSSIVATLTEDPTVAISATPGTTFKADQYTYTVDGQELYQLIDTPGFQRPGTVLNWLQAHTSDASDRRQVVANFVAEHHHGDRFRDECELLAPLLAGAGIIYVVDGSKPYGPEYEAEMEILQWTGQPRMALINFIGSGDYSAQWRQSLGQYFSIVRSFNATQADFASRIGLLRAFGELDEDWHGVLNKAIETLQESRQQRLHSAAVEVSGLIWNCLRLHKEAQVPADQQGLAPAQEAKLRQALLDELVKLETQAREAVQNLFNHGNAEVVEDQLSVVDGDLFATQTWQVFGLSRTQLLATGSVSGALAGGGFDLLTGGTSLMAGSLIGAVVGGVSAWLGGDEIARIKVLGTSLGGTIAQVGPIANINFPWVLLGRACLHLQLVSERNHAARDTIVASAAESEHFFASLPSPLRKRIELCFQGMRDGDPQQINLLTEIVVELIAD